MSRGKTLVGNLGLFALNAVATKLITFLLVPLYTYYLTRGEFGITDMSTTVLTLISPVVTLSISDAVLRYMIEKPENKIDYVTVGLIFTMSSCFIVLMLLPLLDLEIFGGLGQYKFLFFSMYIANCLQGFCNSVARGLDQITLITWTSIISSLVTSLSAVTFIGFIGLGVRGFFYSIIFGNIIGLLLYWIFGKQYLYVKHISFKRLRELLIQMIPYAVPLIPNMLFWWIGTSINRFFITGMLGISATGLFAASMKIPNLLNLIYNIFYQAWTLSAFQEYRKKNVANFFGLVFKLLSGLMALCGSLIILLAPWLASFFLKRSFYTSWTLMPILVVAFFFNTLGSFFGTVYTASMKTRQLFTTTVVASIIGTFLTWILIHPLGLFGPCVAMLFSNAVLFVIRFFDSRRILQMPVDGISLLITTLLIGAQSVITSLEVPHYELISILCVFSIGLTQTYALKSELHKLIHGGITCVRNLGNKR
jgi:O-antigen/teichoic acid export membrane protein